MANKWKVVVAISPLRELKSKSILCLFLVKQKLFSKYTGLTPAPLEVERIFVVRPICGGAWALTF